MDYFQNKKPPRSPGPLIQPQMREGFSYFKWRIYPFERHHFFCFLQSSPPVKEECILTGPSNGVNYPAKRRRPCIPAC